MTDTPKDKDNVVDFQNRKSSSKGKGGGDGTDGGPDRKLMYYEVSPVIHIDEAEKLMTHKYLTQSGYLDILGLLNQIQEYNMKKVRKVLTTSILAAIATAALTTVLLSRIGNG